MVMISGTVDGSQGIARIQKLVPKIDDAVKQAILEAAINLRSYIITNKLSGTPLHHRTGNLIDNLMPPEMTETQDEYQARLYVGTGAPYAAVHEFGDVFTRMVSKAWGREMKHPHDVTFHYPKRSFMYSSLDEQRAVVLDRIDRAITEGLKD